MKVTAKTLSKVEQLAKVQSRKTKLRAQLTAVESEEDELIAELDPILSVKMPRRQHTDFIKTPLGEISINLVHVKRVILDVEKAEAKLEELGERIPRKRVTYTLLKVRNA